MANIHPPILHDLLRKEKSFRTTCHLPHPITFVLACLPKNNLKFIIIGMLLFPSYLSSSHLIHLLSFTSFCSRKFIPPIYPSQHNPPAQNIRKTTESLSFWTLHFHCLLISFCPMTNIHALLLVNILRGYCNTNSITIKSSFK